MIRITDKTAIAVHCRRSENIQNIISDYIINIIKVYVQEVMQRIRIQENHFVLVDARYNQGIIKL